MVATDCFGFSFRAEVETVYTDSFPPGIKESSACCKPAFFIKRDTQGYELPLEILGISPQRREEMQVSTKFKDANNQVKDLDWTH